VLGAGLAGVTTAWRLAADGHEVVVLEREAQAGAGASFASGGIQATSRAFPWTAQGVGGAVRRALFGFDAELAGWGLQHLLHRGRAAWQRILEAKLRLALYARECHEALVREAGLEYPRLTNGVLYFYRSEAALEHAWERATPMRERGMPLSLIPRKSLVEFELGLRHERLAGALHAPADGAGDAALFCRSLALACQRKGVQFFYECEILGLQAVDVSVTEVLTRRGRVRGNAFVCALGVIKPKLRAQLGVRLPIYPVKGYSATVALANPAAAPCHAGIDEERGVSFCPMGDTLRITGGEALAGYERAHTPEDFAPLYGAFDELFPGAADFTHARVRACQRPMTPETTPRFGVGQYANFWFNVGYGHMGWALAAGGAHITADLVAGRTPAIDLEGLRVRRA
jgi:D-amino-acid dehydrogenase